MIDALILLLVANGTPVVVRRVLPRQLGVPLDGDRLAPDGNPWLGSSKTWVGIVSAVIATAAAAQLLGYGWVLGSGFAALAMLGDLISSFIKRRLGLRSGRQVPGLDQLPEALLPLILYDGSLGLGWRQVLILITVFFMVDLLLTRTLARGFRLPD